MKGIGVDIDVRSEAKALDGWARNRDCGLARQAWGASDD